MNPYDNDKKFRYPLAIFLSSLIFLVWVYLNQESSVPPTPQEEAAPTNVEEVTNNVPAGNGVEDVTNNPLAQIEIAEAGEPQAAALPKLVPTVKSEVKMATLVTPVMKITFSSKNAAVVEVVVGNRTNEVFSADGSVSGSIDELSPNLEAGGQLTYATGRLVFGTEEDETLFYSAHQDLFYSISKQTANELQFVVRLPAKNRMVEIIKTYSISEEDKNRLSLTVDVRDVLTRAPLPLGYYVINGSTIAYGTKDRPRSVLDIERLSYQIGDDNEEVLGTSFFGSDDTFEVLSTMPDWVALDNRFYARVLAADGGAATRVIFAKKTFQKEDESEDYYYSAIRSASTAQAKTFHWHFLPKSRELLDMYYTKVKAVYFDLFHQFSIMRILSSVMYFLLVRINDLFKNFGVSIIIMTILIKLLTYPLTQKSMTSIAKMQTLTPKINAIKAQYKATPQRMNTEMMMLYRREGVSPLSGCLPMMIPIPIFIALYSLFQNMVELRGIGFWWIGDLSLPDTIASFESSLPFLGNSIHLLPIVMTIISFTQVLLPSSVATGTPENPQMKGMKYFFPVFFFFICWNLPSALVLFWTTQNIFSLLQSILLRKKMKKA